MAPKVNANVNIKIVKTYSNTKGFIYTIKFDNFYQSVVRVSGLLHFLQYSILKPTISQSGALYHTFVEKVRNLIFQPLHTAQSLFTTIIIHLDDKPYTILYYIVDLVDITTEIQICSHNETEHILPTYSRIPILL